MLYGDTIVSNAQAQAQPQPSSSGVIGFIERAGKKIPDPVIIFMFLFAFSIVLTAMIGGLQFEALGADGGMIQYSICLLYTSDAADD